MQPCLHETLMKPCSERIITRSLHSKDQGIALTISSGSTRKRLRLRLATPLSEAKRPNAILTKGRGGHVADSHEALGITESVKVTMYSNPWHRASHVRRLIITFSPGILVLAEVYKPFVSAACARAASRLAASKSM